MADIALQSSTRKIRVVRYGIMITTVAGAAVTSGMVCRINTAGRAVGADGGAAGTADVAGIAIKDAASGEAVTLMKEGELDGFNFTDQAYNAPLYLSDSGTNTGVIADAAGTVSVRLGRVIPAWSNENRAAPDKVMLVDIAG